MHCRAGRQHPWQRPPDRPAPTCPPVLQGAAERGRRLRRLARAVQQRDFGGQHRGPRLPRRILDALRQPPGDGCAHTMLSSGSEPRRVPLLQNQLSRQGNSSSSGSSSASPSNTPAPHQPPPLAPARSPRGAAARPPRRRPPPPAARASAGPRPPARRPQLPGLPAPHPPPLACPPATAARLAAWRRPQSRAAASQLTCGQQRQK